MDWSDMAPRERELYAALQWVLDQVSWRDYHYWPVEGWPRIIKRGESCTSAPTIDDDALMAVDEDG